MIRRRVVLVYWIVALSLFTPEAVYAYIDPATTTYLIQIATALVVTIGVSLSIFLYKFRLISSKVKYWVYGLFYRSSAKKKETEDPGKTRAKEPWSPPEYVIDSAGVSPDLVSFDEGIREALLAGKADVKSDKPGRSGAEPRTYAGRMRAAVPLALAFSFSFIVIGCLELAIQFAPEIPFRISAIIPYVLLVFALVFAFFIVVVPLFKGRVFEILLVVGFSILLAGYIQGTFLNFGLGLLTGDAVIWGDMKLQIALSMVCWIGCFVLAAYIWRRAGNVWRKLLLFVPLMLILLQGIGFISVIYEKSNESMLDERGHWGSVGDFWKTVDEALTTDRINEVASETNAIIIILDRLDQEFVEEIAAGDPGFFDPLDGFTEFNDFVTYNGSTFPSVAGYLTGNRYMYDMPRPDYFDYAWANALFFHALKDRDIDVRLYLERGQAYSRISQLGGIASNTFEGELGINKRIALVKLLKLSGYRYAPMPLKQLFWIAPTEFIDAVELTAETTPYLMNDFKYYANLKEEGLSVSESETEAMIYIHLQGPHPPLRMDENIQYVEESTLVAQAKGAFRIVYEYLAQLKELNLYESSTIVIMGDHGNYLGDDLPGPARTGLLVKPAGSSGTPLKISGAPVSPDQLHATLFEGLFGSSGEFGDTFFDIGEGDDMLRLYAINLWRYEIAGDGRDFSNWSFIGLFPDTYK